MSIALRDLEIRGAGNLLQLLAVTPVLLADWQEVRLARTDAGAVYNAAAGALEFRMPRDGDLVAYTAERLGALLSRRR